METLKPLNEEFARREIENIKKKLLFIKTQNIRMANTGRNYSFIIGALYYKAGMLQRYLNKNSLRKFDLGGIIHTKGIPTNNPSILK